MSLVDGIQDSSRSDQSLLGIFLGNILNHFIVPPIAGAA